MTTVSHCVKVLIKTRIWIRVFIVQEVRGMFGSLYRDAYEIIKNRYYVFFSVQLLLIKNGMQLSMNMNQCMTKYFVTVWKYC